MKCLICLLGVAVCTWLSFRFGQDLASVGFLYLVFVVLAALYAGFWQATLISIISVASLDYFFNEPIFSFRVDRVSSWVQMAVFEFTALVVSRLSDQARLRAIEAIVQRRDTARLYETARQILLIDSHGDTGAHVVSVVRREFDLQGVLLFDALPATVFESGDPAADSDRDTVRKRTQQACREVSDTYFSDSQTWICVLRKGDKTTGALVLRGTEMSELNARAVASLAAIALERDRAIERQYHAEAARQAEKLRTAVLDALAHKFKTPLTIIRTAAAGLGAIEGAPGTRTELIGLIDQEASRLSDLAHRLVGARELDSHEADLQHEPVLISRLVTTAIDELDQEQDRVRFRVAPPAGERPVLADRGLILTALAQLTDNAIKYSQPGTPIEVQVKGAEGSVVLMVRSKGLVVEPGDRERIFERFYRAPGAERCAAGTGLGLSIVRTIATDHRGHVCAEGEPGYGTTISLSLPVLRQDLP